MRMRTSGALVMAAIGWSALFGQSFEVVSVKPADPTSHRSGDFRVLPGARLEVTDLTLSILIREAFGVKRYQISGGPKWLETDRFDISARAAAESSRDQIMLMTRRALTERFKLAVRRETREGNVYVLVAPPSGSREGQSVDCSKIGNGIQRYSCRARSQSPDKSGLVTLKATAHDFGVSRNK
jgi:uncharacterized protein (TIGR03435 family)